MMAKKNLYTVEIAGVIIQIHTEKELLVNESFAPFLVENNEADIQVFFRQLDTLPQISENVIYQDCFYKVHQDEDNYVCSFFNAPRDLSVYAIATNDKEMTRIYVEYLEKGAHYVSELRNCFVHLNLESILIRRKRIFLHAACVNTPLGGLLFSGSSGIGKSTQAELWSKYRNAMHINGDRPILSREENGWLAWGSPYAGSSKYHVNEKCPVTAIVLLKQDKTCSIRRLHHLESFRAVWAGLTVHSWDPKFVEKATDLALDLIRKVPVFEFCCTPDEQAVDFLEKELRKECNL